MVLLNPPGKTTVTVNVDGSYADPNGEVVSRVTLAAKQGIVLVGEAAEAKPAVAVSVRINVCGVAAQIFGTDQYFGGGHCDQLRDSIDLKKAVGAAPMTVYQSKRTTNPGNPGFLCDQQPGGRARLSRQAALADDQSRNVGNRVFNVFVNGKLALKNFDIYAATGGRLRAIVKDVYGVKPDGNGNIIIQYQNVKGNALASGLSILP